MRQLETDRRRATVSRRPPRVPQAVRLRQRDLARSGSHSRCAHAPGSGRVEPRVGRGARPPEFDDEHRADARGRLDGLDADDGRIRSIADWSGRSGCTWSLGYADGSRDAVGRRHAADARSVRDPRGLERPLYVLPNGAGIGYGLFVLDDTSRTYLLAHVEEIPDALTRGSAWVTLWDNLLERACRRRRLPRRGLRALPREIDEQNAQRVLAYIDAHVLALSAPDRAARPVAGARGSAPRRHRSRADAEPEGGLVQRLSRHGAVARRAWPGSSGSGAARRRFPG